MKILYIHPNTIRSGWHVWNGAQRMAMLGHDVTDIKIVCDANGRIIPFDEQGAELFPGLGDYDLVVVAAPEFVWYSWLKHVYPGWDNASVKKVALYAEGSARSIFSDNEFDIRKHFDVGWYPSRADALGRGRWRLPGIDLGMFRPSAVTAETIDVGFVGSIYDKRRQFIDELTPHLKTDLVCGSPAAFDVAGEDQIVWTHLYVSSINKLRIHLSLPSLNDFPTHRPYETMACGTLLFEPQFLPEPFVEGDDYIFYDSSDLQGLAKELRRLVNNKRLREVIATHGMMKCRKHCSDLDMWRDCLTV